MSAVRNIVITSITLGGEKLIQYACNKVIQSHKDRLPKKVVDGAVEIAGALTHLTIHYLCDRVEANKEGKALDAVRSLKNGFIGLVCEELVKYVCDKTVKSCKDQLPEIVVDWVPGIAGALTHLTIDYLEG